MELSKDALNYRVVGLSTVESSCKRILRVEDAKSGRTVATPEASLLSEEGRPNSLFAHVKLTIDGRTSGEPELLSFSFKIELEAEVQFDSAAPDPDKIPQEVIKSIIEPIFFTALERARHSIWELGYSGVKLPIKRFVLDPAPKKSATKAAKETKNKRRPSKKSAEE